MRYGKSHLAVILLSLVLSAFGFYFIGEIKTLVLIMFSSFLFFFYKENKKGSTALKFISALSGSLTLSLMVGVIYLFMLLFRSLLGILLLALFIVLLFVFIRNKVFKKNRGNQMNREGLRNYTTTYFFPL